jgi:carbamoyl-phosphate synthase large subunit
VIAEDLGLPIFATPGTAEALRSLGIACTSLGKGPADGAGALSAIENGSVDLVINVPVAYDELGRPDGYLIRRRAVDAGIPLLTDLQLARAVIEALRHKKGKTLQTLAYDEYLARIPG